MYYKKELNKALYFRISAHRQRLACRSAGSIFFYSKKALCKALYFRISAHRQRPLAHRRRKRRGGGGGVLLKQRCCSSLFIGLFMGLFIHYRSLYSLPSALGQQECCSLATLALLMCCRAAKKIIYPLKIIYHISAATR